jgi:hypothetical protein
MNIQPIEYTLGTALTQAFIPKSGRKFEISSWRC